MRFSGFDGEWEYEKIAKVFTLFNGYAFSSLDSVKTSGVLWVKIADVGIDEMKTDNLSYLPNNFLTKYEKYILKEGDYIVALTRPILNDKLKISRVNSFFHNSLLNQRVAKVTTNHDINFVFNLLKGHKLIKSIQNNIAGSDPPNLSSKDINNIKVFIPELLEQNKIASFLSLIDNRIHKQSKIIQSLESLMSGLVQDIFSQKLRFKNDEGNEFPDWVSKKLSEIGEIITGKTPKTSDKKLWNGNIDFVTPTDIIEGEKYQIKTSRKVKETESIKILPKGAILYTCIASIGKITITKNLSISNQQINSLIVKGEYSNEFVYYALLNLTPKIKATQSTTTLPIINKTDFSKFKINLPSLTEQTKIANFLSSIDEKINKEKSVLEQYQQQKKYLLQNLFI